MTRFFLRSSSPISQETQNDSEKLKRDSLANGIVSLEAKQRDLSDFVKRNEAMDPEKAVKLRSDGKASGEILILILICRPTSREGF